MQPSFETWPLGRPKLKPMPDGSKRSYYGAYPSGFLERARYALGCPLDVAILRKGGGMVKERDEPREPPARDECDGCRGPIWDVDGRLICGHCQKEYSKESGKHGKR